MDLRPLEPGDLPRLLALHNRVAPKRRHTTAGRLEAGLCDRVRDGGRQVAVAWQGGAPVGYIGWVGLGAAEGQFYGSPMVAADQAVARVLIARVLDEGRAAGADWVRIGALPDEVDKIAALRRAGFRIANEMLELELELRSGVVPEPAVALPAALVPVAVDRLDIVAVTDLENECFREVANAPPMDPDSVRESWTRGVWLEASRVLADEHGAYQAFLRVLSDGIIDAIGVRAAHRGTGVATALLGRAVAIAAREEVPLLRSMVAADNVASLALHLRFGFTVEHRRQVWQRSL